MRHSIKRVWLTTCDHPDVGFSEERAGAFSALSTAQLQRRQITRDRVPQGLGIHSVILMAKPVAEAADVMQEVPMNGWAC